MKPYFDDGKGIVLYHGDCRTVLARLESESVQCCVTSPPYWSLRDYGVAPTAWGGASECEHKWDHRSLCRKCGAWLGCLGLEHTPELFAANIVEVFRAVRRVLRPDGTLWLNIGDSYCNTDKWGGGGNHGKHTAAPDGSIPSWDTTRAKKPSVPGLKPKDRVMMPARIALALQADGWWLRDEIVWSKPNAMPASVRDRTCPAHEFIYMLTKRARYFYDQGSISERAMQPIGISRSSGQKKQSELRGKSDTTRLGSNQGAVTRTKRSVWRVSTKPFKGAHFATFPPKLIEPCILAGCPEGGIVLDPFVGSGTTGIVAIRHGRRFIGIDANESYAEMAVRRIGREAEKQALFH